MKVFFQRHYKKIIIFSLALTVFISVLNANNDSLIYDEDAHIPAGYSYLKTFDMRLNPEHPPLLKDLSAIPLLFINPTLDTTQDFWEQNPNDAQWNSGKSFLFNSGNDPDQIIFWSRLPIILIFIALSLFIFFWTKEIAGIGAGLLAFILFTFDPNVLGHNHYVTTDLGIAAFITFVFYYFLKFLKNPNKKSIWLLGIFLALVQLTKFSSVLIFPVFGLILVIYALSKLAGHKKETTLKFRLNNLREYLWKFIIAFMISIVIVWIAYALSTFNMPEEKLPQIVGHYFAKEDALSVNAKKVIISLNENPVLRPMAIYLFGVLRVFQRVAGGNVTYFFGQLSTHGFYSYFPVVFLIKTPLTTLFLIFSAIGIALYNLFKKSKNERKVEKIGILSRLSSFVRTRTTESLLLLFIFIYCFTSITGRLNIGLRHLFPIFPFIYILTSKTIFTFLKKIKPRIEKRIAYGVVIGLAVILIFETLSVYPNYLSYFNYLVGGPKNGYHYVTDSNADWGQDLKRLKNWIEEYNHCAKQSEPQKCNSNKYTINPSESISKIRVDYFGLADLNYYLGSYYESWWNSRRPIEEGHYALSTLFLQESLYDTRKEDHESYRWLINKKPIYQVGTSILIYKITAEDLTE